MDNNSQLIDGDLNVELDNNWELISDWMKRSESIIVKKLSRNDSAWADARKSGEEAVSGQHATSKQNGIYLPVRVVDFFKVQAQSTSDKPHILFADLFTYWPASGQTLCSRLTRYTNKPSETQLTRLPKEHFQDLSPASLLVGGRVNHSANGANYWFIVVDSESEDAERLEEVFDIGVEFRADIFDSSYAHGDRAWEMAKTLDEIDAHLQSGTISDFIRSAAVFPHPQEMARQAQDHFTKYYNLKNLDPFKIACPGDAIMKISREIEYKKYKTYELRHRAAQIIQILQRQAAANLTQAVVRGFSELNEVFLSASQHRRSRAGLSFEYHIARMLKDGRIHHEAQKVTSRRRPDFVLPTLDAVRSSQSRADEALLLSAKTTLRERWKQLSMERFACGRFLATVDDRVSAEAIDEMSKEGICLIVPESLKSSDEICYRDKSNVIAFRTFFDDEVVKRRPGLRY
ncbi:type II restriction endonuclease [Paraburkholderia hospita]|uniref:type II restriction endonuclease n=1 Tax=Paraburkholderia hospita TaxID=169430 RepID=UPI003ECCFFC6